MMSPRLLPLLAVLPALVVAGGVRAERRDHERARAALEAGQIRPLSELLSHVERQFAGRIIEAELEAVAGGWRYEIKVLPVDGKLLTVVMDAITGSVVRPGPTAFSY